MSILQNKECDYKNLSPLTLAFIGDGVYDLMVRQELVSNANAPVGKLNSMKVEKVCCQAQSEAINKILETLTQEELTIYKRGRNAHTKSIPKNATQAQYHSATGMEALFGYIYLKGDIERLNELFCLVYKI